MLRLTFPYVPYVPHARQAVFLSDAMNQIEEVLYGGAAGGGKSDALLMAALQYVDVPEYSALIIRKSYGELTMDGGILDRAHLWFRRRLFVEDPDGVLRLSPGQLRPGTKGNESRHAEPGEGKSLVDWGLVTWIAGEWSYVFPSGARLRFGHMQTKEARLKYAGSEFQFIGVDELTTLHGKEATFLISRLRGPAPPEDPEVRDEAIAEAERTGKMQLWMVPPRFRAGTNPGGPGHTYVRDRYIGQPKKDIPRNEPSARFVSALVDDNPSVDQRYRERLDKLDPVSRRQLKLGDWDDAIQGELFDRTNFGVVQLWEVRDTQWPEAPVRYWDLAATEERTNESGTAENDPDWAVGLLMARDDYHWYVLDVVRVRNEPAKLDAAIDATAKRDGTGVRIVVEQEPGSSGKIVVNNIARRLAAYDVTGHRPSGSKEARARVVSSKVSQQLVRVVEAAWNAEFFDELELFPSTEHDDQVDALSGAYAALLQGGEADSTDTTEDVDEPDDHDELLRMLRGR